MKRNKNLILFSVLQEQVPQKSISILSTTERSLNDQQHFADYIFL